MDRFSPILPRQLGIGQADGKLAPVAPNQLPDTPGKMPDVKPEALADGIDPAYRAKAVEAAQKFESFFIGKMLHQMRSSSRELASEEEGQRDAVHDDMLDMADTLVADQMAGQRAFGIADAILRQLLPTAAPVAPPAGTAFPLGITKSSSGI